MNLSNNSVLQNGKYRIVRVLGQGGFGITYLAENTFFDKQVAIKEFFPRDFCGRDNTSHLTLGTQNNAETVAKLKERFLKEAKNIAQLDHPGIVKIHDIFEENNTAYYVMDYIEGENLNDIVKRDGPLPESKAVEYVIKVGEALEYIHSRKMTHFDVKPANIVVSRSEDRPILIDFGLSKQYDVHGDATSMLMQGVSQGYSPIELYNVGSIATFSPQTDVYSLGATLYFLLVGNTPSPAPIISEKGLSLGGSISLHCREVLKNCMATNRNERTASIRGVIEQLSMSFPGRRKTIADSYQQYNDETYFINNSSTTHSPSESGNFATNLKEDTSKETGNDVPIKKHHRIRNFAIFLILLGAIIAITGGALWFYYSAEETNFKNSPESQYLPMPNPPDYYN